MVSTAAKEQIARRRAHLLARLGPSKEDSSLVALGDSNAVGHGVAVHPVGGGITPYLGLAQALSPDICLHAIRADGFAAGETPRTSIPAMAGAYCTLLPRRPD